MPISCSELMRDEYRRGDGKNRRDRPMIKDTRFDSTRILVVGRTGWRLVRSSRGVF